MKTKVLFLFVHLNYGGAEVGLLTTLKNIDRDRFDCTVVSIEKGDEVGREIERSGFRVIYLNDNARLFNLPLIGKIASILRREEPDILHTSLFYANFFGRMAALFSKPCAIVTEERSVYTEKRFYHIALDRLLSAVTDKIIVCSNSVLDFTAKRGGIDREKLYLIYNAVDASRFDIQQDKDTLRDKLGFSKDAFVVGTVGSIIPKKGHRVLIDACRLLNKDIPLLKLLIIGEGESRKDLMDLVRDYGMEKEIIFLGSRRDIPQLMKAMDLFVLPSFQEGFPRTLVEAMYMGLPVIASNISGIPEIVRDGENGILVRPGDSEGISAKMLGIYKDAALKNRLGVNARKTVESGYLPRHYIGKLEELYTKLMERVKR